MPKIIIFLFFFISLFGWERPLSIVTNFETAKDTKEKYINLLNDENINLFLNPSPKELLKLFLNNGSFLFINPPNFKQTIFKKIKEKSVAVLFEPKVVLPYCYELKNLDFKKILSFDDSLVDGNKIIKFYYPVWKPIQKSENFFNRRLFCMMCGNKKSNQKGELYSERKKIIEFFKNDSDFELYGSDWDNMLCYKGFAPSKGEILSKIKFNICLENSNNQPGYITEKIFDSFIYGAIPIYAGPPNINDYIPKDCYIDYFSFSNMNKLKEFILNFSESDYEDMIKKIETFMESPQAKKFQRENFFFTICEAIKSL